MPSSARAAQESGVKKYAPRITQRYLGLNGTKITDASLAHLRGLSRLRVLYIQDTQITDAGLKHLRGLSQLKFLDLTTTQIGYQGCQELQKTLPNLVIHR